ncbi:MAG: HDOD domain-containing protein [Thermodesulfobacteriota bacterium]|nr:HDOD domain-containing protein [Thermodesulfobacteriota bacterium]
MEITSLLPSKKAVLHALKRDVEELPTLPAVAIKLLEIIQDERSSASDLAKVVESEPAITARLLKIVNSAAYGFQRKISSVNRAVTLLGFSTVRGLAIGVTLFDQLISPHRKRGFDPIFFWQHCLSVAGLCRAFAEATNYPNPEEAYVAGLLHDVGKIIMNANGRISYADFVKNSSNADGDLTIEGEQKVIGISHDKLGAYFCNAWNLPERLVYAVLLHHQRFAHLNLPHENAKLIAILSFSNFMAWIQGLGSVEVFCHPVVQPEVSDIINLEDIDLSSMVACMDREVKNTAEFYKFSFPTTAQFRENLLRANIELGRLNTKFLYVHEDQQKKIISLTKAKESIIHSYRTFDQRKIISCTLEAIHRQFGFNRMYVMRVDKSNRNLITIGYLDRTDLEMDFSSLGFQLTSNSGGLIECLRKHVPVLIKGESRGEIEILERLEISEMGAVPFSNNNQIMGVIGVDNVISGKAIQVTDLSALAVVANELGMALENARAFKEMKVRASMDGLTKVHNRASIEDILPKVFRYTKAEGRKLSIAMIDVDHFKKFNDRFGHLVGDNILKLIAGTINKLSRPSDVVGRYGGDEFLVILKHTDITDGIRYVERIRNDIENLARLLIRRFPGHPLTVSIGITAYHSTIMTKEELIANADQALYLAKDAGRNKVVSIFADNNSESRPTLKVRGC